VSAALRAPGDWVPVAILPLGYADELPSASSRRSLDDLVHEL